MSDSDDVWPPRPNKEATKKGATDSGPSSSGPAPKKVGDSPRASSAATSAKAKPTSEPDETSWPPRKSSSVPAGTAKPTQSGPSSDPRNHSKNPGRPREAAPETVTSQEKQTVANEAGEWPPAPRAARQRETTSKKSPKSQAPQTKHPTASSRKPNEDAGLSTATNTHLESYAGRIGPGQAISSAFRKYANFTGLASTSEFWWFVLFYLIAGSIASLDTFIFALFVLGLLLPSLALTTRRLRDAGFRWGWMLTLLVPFIGFFVIAVLASMPSRKQTAVDSKASLNRTSTGSDSSAGRIPALEVDRTPLSPLDRSAATGTTILAFLLSWIGLGALYLYFDARQTWRNPHRSGEFALVSTLFVLFSAGMGFALTSYRWWAHSGDKKFKKLAWLGLAPIGLFTILGPIYSGMVPGTPPVNAASVVLSFISLFILSIWNFATAVRMSSRL